MLKRILAGLSALALMAIILPASAQAQMEAPSYEVQTITGTVVDLSCKFGHGLSGADHRMCAQVCADKGIPLVILGSDGKLYLPITADMPGSSSNDQLKEYAEQEVTVTGQVFSAGGASAIRIDEIKKS
ncbi:MAG: hypothetical protein O7E49_14515 [Gemmatimonadetes bacterium]|nr:hypothetical protein [Gemmatimonadota bacterium]